MLKIRTASAAVVLALTSALLLSPTASAAMPDASVSVNPQAFEGQRNTIVGNVWARCAPGFKFAGLTIRLTQAGFSATTTGKSIPCDGVWRKQQFITPQEAWDPGPATSTARLRVTDINTGAQGTPGVQTRQIYVRPGAKIEIPATATLRPNGVVKLVLRARCDKPWVLTEFALSASQGEFPNQATWNTDSDTYPTCDGAFHTRTFEMLATQGNFHKGWLRVDSHIHTVDPDEFDPAPGAIATRMVKVQ